MYFQQFGGPLQQIASFFSDIQRALVGGQHILELLKTPSEIVEKPSENQIPLIQTRGEIEFRKVTFAYETEPVLKDISILINSKQRIAIVGPTGAGKTTFASLIPRFFDIIQGEILLDGHNIKDYGLHSLRSQIGLVLQDSYLFNESVLDNIRFGRWSATEEEIYAITKKIGIHDFVSHLPNGYNTVVGERGTVLSVGQCQLIAIARTLLSNPPILILDEATSSVDAYSEVLIQRALDELLRSRTCIIIAHRFSTISSADKILVMNEGKIIQQGHHRELINQEGLYQKYYRMQFSENQIKQ
jgi:ATP-binding cassette subfamily B protein